MSTRKSIAWLKSTFHTEIAQAISGTPFCENLLAAIAYQETGYIWGSLIGTTSTAQILKLCVGDSIGAPKRTAFPTTKAQLLGVKDGDRMFRLARKALEEVAAKTGHYAGAVKDPDKFCRGFGIFQYDLQFFKKDPAYFLNEDWSSFGNSLAKCVAELKTKLKKVFGNGKTSLTDIEKAHLAIAYNTGGFNPAKGLKQGHENSQGEFYGELFFEYFQIAKTVNPSPADTSKPPLVVVSEPGRTEPVAPLALKAAAPAYPGHLLERNTSDTANTLLIQQRLKSLGYTQRNSKGQEVALKIDGDFGLHTQNAVELFQMRHTDSNGLALVVDGVVGPATWAALFGLATLPVALAPASGSLPDAVIRIAAGEVGVREVPPGSNRGPRVNDYLKSVGLGGGYAWCAAFVFWCFREGSKQLGQLNPAIKTAGVLDMWNRARAAGFLTVGAKEAAANPSLLAPGMIFVFSTGSGLGHTGIVIGINGLQIETIEGNTDAGGSRNGIGVFRRHRSIKSINCGFIDYSRMAQSRRARFAANNN
jgi:hypothetical protein